MISFISALSVKQALSAFKRMLINTHQSLELHSGKDLYNTITSFTVLLRTVERIVYITEIITIILN